MAPIPFPSPPATAPPNVLSLGPLSLPAASSCEAELGGPARVRVADVAPYEGAPCGGYVKAVEAISGSLTRHNAAVIELGSEEMAVMRCAFEGARMYFRARAANGGKAGRGVYIYRAGRYNLFFFFVLPVILVGDVEVEQRGNECCFAAS